MRGIVPYEKPDQGDLFYPKSNAFANAACDWDKLSDIIIHALAAAEDPGSEADLGWTTIYFSDIYGLIKSNTIWDRIKELAETLSEAKIKFRNDNQKKVLVLNVLQKVYIQNENGYKLTVQWGEGMKPYIRHSFYNYSRQSLYVRSTFRGDYSRHVYDIVNPMVDKGFRKISFDDLRWKLIMPKRYTYVSQVKPILDRVVSDFDDNQYCPYTITYTIEREKTKNPMFVFQVHPRPAKIAPEVPKTAHARGPEDTLQAQFDTWKMANHEEYRRHYMEAKRAITSQLEMELNKSREKPNPPPEPSPEEFDAQILRMTALRLRTWFFKDGPGSQVTQNVGTYE